MKPILLLLIFNFGFVSFGRGDANSTPAPPLNGTFFTYTGYMTTVLELKEGRFRYWFESDAKSEKEPVYPLTGEYKVQGDRVLLDHPEIYQKEWSFRWLNGQVSLWRPDAFESMKAVSPADLKRLKTHGGGNILILSKESPEKIWKNR